MAINTLTVAVVPLDIAWGDRAENLYQVGRLAGKLRGRADVIVFPELFSTGFISDPVQMAEMADTVDVHPSLDAMRAAAHSANAAVCGSVLHAVEDSVGGIQYYNRCYFVEPDGETTVYDKHHLFCLGAESRVMTAGTTPVPVVRFRGCNISMAVCFDLRFPSWLRNRPANPYDLLLLPSNWPQSRQLAWETLLRARAIENQAFVVGANRSGSDDMGTYDDMTAVFDPLGAPLGQTEPDTGITFAQVDVDALHSFRTDMPFLSSAD